MATIDPRSAPSAVKEWLDSVRPAIDQAIAGYIDRACDAGPSAEPLREAIRYAALGPGKRLRPALCLAACQAVSGTHEPAWPAAAAVEMLHAYTLVHDDLPAMDDDTMRRGRPTVHIEFGESIAILTGDALLTAAFGALADLGPHAGDAVSVLAARTGAGQLIAGQVLDLALAERGDLPSFAELEQIHAAKTGALFSAAAELGAIAAGADGEKRARMADFGLAIGIAFQHADDRDDKDFAEYAAQASARMAELTAEAESLAKSFGPSGHILATIAAWMASRA